MRVGFELQGADQFNSMLARKIREIEPTVLKAFTVICVKWEYEAKRRVPVETGLLRNKITHEVGRDSEGLFGAVGSDQKYAVYIEFGTKWIAAGNVKRLGLNPEITDSQSIKIWPAKNEGIIDSKTGELKKNLRGAGGRFLAGGTTEQMPWLRSSFMSIRDWAMKKLEACLDWD